MDCILCQCQAQEFFCDSKTNWRYYLCPQCDLRFLAPDHRLDAEAEFKRYLTHENDPADVRYQNFFRPLFDLVCSEVPKNKCGLDYGCGPGPALAQMLTGKSYEVSLYDPFFHHDPEALNRTYDFICSTEAVEHFYHPAAEFKKLNELLNKNGHLFIMTHIYDSGIDFSTWYYRHDPTHVCFYSNQTFEYICKFYRFLSYKKIGDRIAWLTS